MNELFSTNISEFRFLAVHAADDEVGVVLFDEDFEQRRFVSAFRTREDVASFHEFIRGAGDPRILILWNAASTIKDLNQRIETVLGRSGKSAVEKGAETVMDAAMLDDALKPNEAGDARAIDSPTELHRQFLELLALASDRAVAKGAGLTLGALIDLAGGYFVFGSTSGKKKRPFRMPPRLEELDQLCGTDARIVIEYAGDSGPRQVTPLEIRLRGSRVFVDAWCHREGARVAFRGDRILRVVRS